MSYRILLVDGDIASRYRLRLALRARGHEVETQASAEPVLRRLTDSTAGAMPDLLLLSNQLPGMSGIEVVQRLRTRPTMRELPIVLCTGSDDPTLAAIAQRDPKVAILRKDRLEASLDAVLSDARERTNGHTEVPIVADGTARRSDPDTKSRGAPTPMAGTEPEEIQPGSGRHPRAAEAQSPHTASGKHPLPTESVGLARRQLLRGTVPRSLPVKLWILVAACCAALIALGLVLLAKG
jgi:CheY-like chemotaxis protein